ncbi:MAG: AAA family ATPase [bacterium]
MRIKKITIQDYGPIKNLTITPENFEFIFGLNESGKTAIVEALTYVLFKRSPTPLRYGKPENTIVQIEEDEILYTLPAKKKNIELPSGDIANLLYVQASESSIYDSKGEASFWDGIKALLSRVGKGVPLTKLDDKIFEAVGLSPRKAEWKKEKQTLIASEQRRKDELGMYLESIGEIEKKATELAHLSEKNDKLKKDLKHIVDYKNYKNYQEISNLYNAYMEKKTHLQEYARYKYDYVTQWQGLEAEKKSRLKDENKLKEVKVEIKDLEREISELKNKEKIIELEDFKSRIAKTQVEVKVPPIIFPLLFVSAATIIFILSFFLTIPKIPAAGILIFSCALFIYFLYKRKKVRKKLAEKNKWLTKAQKLFPDISSFTELSYKIETMEKMTIEKQTLLTEKIKLIDHLSKEETVTSIEKETSDLRNKTGIAELSDLKKKIDTKRKIDTELSKLDGKISGMLSERDDKKWERIIREMRTKRPEKEPDIISEKDLKNEAQKIQERINELTREIKIFKEVEQTKFNITDDRSAFIQYDRLQKRLENYTMEKKAALTVREIFKKMSSELDEFINDIITGNDSLSEYFEFVTERYDEVEIKNKNFVVKEKSGGEFSADDLSSGAKDQLFLCFRLAALKHLFPKGSFLILDDAFIFADWARRQKLVDLLKKFIKDGNQVIYLTSDNHTRDILKESGARIITI